MHRIFCTSAAVRLLTTGASCAGVADLMASAGEALDCSGEGELYEPLIGLRVGALLGILAVSSIGGADLSLLSRLAKTCF